MSALDRRLPVISVSYPPNVDMPAEAQAGRSFPLCADRPVCPLPAPGLDTWDDQSTARHTGRLHDFVSCIYSYGTSTVSPGMSAMFCFRFFRSCDVLVIEAIADRCAIFHPHDRDVLLRPHIPAARPPSR